MAPRHSDLSSRETIPRNQASGCLGTFMSVVIRGKKTVMVNASLAESEHLLVNGVHHPVGINQPIIIDMDRNTKNIIGMKGIIV